MKELWACKNLKLRENPPLKTENKITTDKQKTNNQKLVIPNR